MNVIIIITGEPDGEWVTSRYRYGTIVAVSDESTVQIGDHTVTITLEPR